MNERVTYAGTIRMLRRDDTAYADHLLGDEITCPSEDVMDQPDTISLSEMTKAEKARI